jgi:FkbM family methyltransferase
MAALLLKLDLSRLIMKLPNYARRFGWFNGFRLLLQVERTFPTESQHVKAYALPTQPAPVYLRETVADHAIFWQCLVQCHYDISRFPQGERLMHAYREAIQRGLRPLIIDGGGNIGLTAIWLAMAFPKATVYTIEPDAYNFEILKRNTASFGKQIRPLKGAIWNEKCRLRIVNPESGSAAFRVAANEGLSSDLIPAYTVQDICRLAGVEHPFMVKLDIEGAQAHLFESNTEWVRNTHVILLELDDWLMPWEGTSRSFFSCISQHAFDYLIHGETIICFRDFSTSS